MIVVLGPDEQFCQRITVFDNRGTSTRVPSPPPWFLRRRMSRLFGRFLQGRRRARTSEIGRPTRPEPRELAAENETPTDACGVRLIVAEQQHRGLTATCAGGETALDRFGQVPVPSRATQGHAVLRETPSFRRRRAMQGHRRTRRATPSRSFDSRRLHFLRSWPRSVFSKCPNEVPDSGP